MQVTDEPLVWASRTPQVTELIDTYKRCCPVTRGWDRLASNDDTRYCRWDNQWSDGKRHGTTENPALPWEGSSDTRVPTADDIIAETAAVKRLAFWRAILRPQPTEMGDIDQAAAQARMLDWLVKNRMLSRLAEEVPISSEYWDAYGWVVLSVTWDRKVQLRNVEITFDALLRAAAMGVPQIEQLPSMLLEPALDQETKQIIEELYQGYVLKSVPGLFADEVPRLRNGQQIIRDLRERQSATVPMPYLLRNEPTVTSLKPWHEIFIPPETTDIQRAPAIFVREWLSEVELRERAITDRYNEQWIEEALKHKGKISRWEVDQVSIDVESIGAAFGFLEDKSGLVEILHCYTRQLDANGVAGIWHTVIHPLVEGNTVGRAWAMHELLDYAHGLMPFVVGRREHASRRIIDSRGIPELVWCSQREEKVQRDSIVDNTSFATVPPILVPLSASKMLNAGGKTALPVPQYRFGPAAQVPVRPGQKPEFMERPPTPLVAFQLIELLERKADRRFGLMSPEIPPALVQLKQQDDVNGFLAMWRLAFHQVFSLTQQYLPADEWSRITGAPPMQSSAIEIDRQYDIVLSFDVRELDPDHVKAKLAAVKDVVLPVDSGGVIDRTKLVRLLLRAIDPSLVNELVQDNASASRRLFERVQTDMALMSLGNEVLYNDEVDPTASRQLEYAKQIIFGDSMGRGGNPRYQQQLQGDERFRTLFENWTKNRMQSVMQQENKQIGRTGVRPVT